MKASVAISLLTLVGMLVACEGDDQTRPGTDPTAGSTSTATSSTSPPTTHGAPSAPASKSANFRVVARATRVLQAAGMTDVVETQPSNDAPNAGMGGHWNGREAVAYVLPLASGITPTHKVIRTFTVDGVRIDEVAQEDSPIRQLWFRHTRDYWAVFVMKRDGIRSDDTLSLELARAVIAAG